MKTVYVYLKFTDYGDQKTTLYWRNNEEPSEWLIKELKMKKTDSRYNNWETTLSNIGEAGFDLISVYPYRKAIKSNITYSSSSIENIYIFKREETVETYLSHQGSSVD